MKMIRVSDNDSSVIGVEILIDAETGVNYLYFGGLSPRYKSDGTLYITPPEEIKRLKNHRNNHTKYV